MESNNTKLIDLYLAGELSPQDKAKFEEALKKSKDLQYELEIQKDVIDGSKRAHQRKQIKDVGRGYHFRRIMKSIGMAVVGVAIVVSSWFAFSKASDADLRNEIPTLSEDVRELLDQNQEFENIELQYFPIPQAGNVVLSKEGTLLSVPEYAFLQNGKPYSGQVILQFQEAIHGWDIIKSGLNTMTGSELLETQGMISIAGYTVDGEQLEINPEVGIYVQLPVESHISGMMLYDGKKLDDGSIDWQNPVPFEKIPVPINMEDLDFYPTGYENHLDTKRWKQNKHSRDSLYLSLEHDAEPVTTLAIEEAPTEEQAEWLNSLPDVEAEFPGGYMAMRTFISENIEYPKWALDNGVMGKVYLNVDIDSDGSIKNVSVLKGVHTSLDEEAIRVARAMPNWTPAMLNGVNVASTIRLPVMFTLSGTSTTNPTALSKGKVFQEGKSNSNLLWNENIQWTTSIDYISPSEAYINFVAEVKDGWRICSSDNDKAEKLLNIRDVVLKVGAATKVQPLGDLEEVEGNIVTVREGLKLKTCRSFRQRIQIITPEDFNLISSVSGSIVDIESEAVALGTTYLKWDNVFGNDSDLGRKNRNNLNVTDADTTEIVDSETNRFILPSKVLGFWKPNFNNTNLSTREFEERMIEIHNTCDNDVLDKYTGQLDRSLSAIDSEVVEMGYPQFQRFADENVGKVELKNPHVKQLKEFYDTACEVLRAESKKNLDTEEKKRKAFDKALQKARSKNQKKRMKEDALYKAQEENFNKENIEKQLQQVNAFTVRRGSFGSRTARLNCDIPRVGRVSLAMNISLEVEKAKTKTIPAQAAIRPIVYNTMSIQVPNASKYLKLYAYVFPNGINSYQRINGVKGKFECRMNSEMIYDIGIVGITEDGYEYFQHMTTKGENLGTVQLEKVSEEKMRASIDQLNNKRIQRPISIKNELKWLMKEREYYKELKRRQSIQAFREEIKQVIFPCYSPVAIEEDKEEDAAQ